MSSKTLWLLLFFLGATAILGVAAEKKDKAVPTEGGKDDIEVPRVAAREPAETVKSFVTRPGFHVELVAAEPLLQSPVALDIDENGRMFVAEFPEYNAFANKKPHGRGRIVMLEDTAHTGRFDRRTVYADNVDLAMAVACWDGGVYVGAPPDLLYCKDTKGDGKADVRRVVYTGFGKDQNGEGMLNSFRWGLDNRLHLSTSLDGGMVRPGDKPNARPVSVRGHGFLLDPRGEAFELTSGGGQFGMSLDDWGRTFVCDNSEPYGLIMYDSRYLARNPHLEAPAAAVSIAAGGKAGALHRISTPEPWRTLKYRLRNFPPAPDYFTGGSGITVYRGDAYPAEYRGNLFVGDVAYNVVHRARVQANGVGLTAFPADKACEFLASRDNWVRPVQFVNAPDGCLWVIDMYRELIEGAAFVPPQILKQLDVGSGADRGRIYRIAPDGFQGRPLPRLGKASTLELVALLQHDNAWHRETALRLLYQWQDRQAIGPLEKLAAAAKSPLARTLALYALDGVQALRPVLVLNGLRDPEPRVRAHAVRLAEPFGAAPALRRRLEEMTDDQDVLVRYQLAFSLGGLPGKPPAAALARLARRDGADPWVALAILSSAHGCAGELFRLLATDAAFRAEGHGRKFLAALATQVGAANRAGDLTVVLQQLEVLAQADKPLARDLVVQLARKQSGLAGKLTSADGPLGKLLAEVLGEARKTAANTDKPVAERVGAVRRLALLSFGDVGPLLADLLASRQPPEVQAAAIETLAGYTDAGVAGTLLAAWKGFSPGVRATAIETLFARPVWINAFLDAVEKNQVARVDVDPARLELLKAYPDPGVKARAARIFAAAGLARRNDVVAAYAKALQIKGDAARGKLVFKTNCAACHRLEGVGQAVGADLQAIRTRGLEAVLLNILDPNREVLAKYLVYILETTNGRVLTGMIVRETATSLTLRRADGVEESIARGQIQELRSTGLSFMPEGLEKQIDVPAMADLLAYLNSVK